MGTAPHTRRRVKRGALEGVKSKIKFQIGQVNEPEGSDKILNHTVYPRGFLPSSLIALLMAKASHLTSTSLLDKK